MDAVSRLTSMGSSSLAGHLGDLSEVPEIIRPLVDSKNGFYAFESALYVLPWGDIERSAQHWNSPDLWTREYGDPVSGLLFFAEDAFGFQFAAGMDGIYSFNPEIAERELVASTVDSWASLILDDYEMQTGFPVIHEWQQKNGAISKGCRLAPVVPFFLGGKFEAEEMRMKESVSLMRFRADVYRQVEGLPDGTQIRMRIE
ncbi:hypothetical protein AB0B89_06775 [Sphaerisporangium sp. NPDC049002]|uniref:hypothetical protein n=1 Tax=unclassified Sphaerisporangium TaxID=2630420 RepID=UPI0033CDD4A0